VTGADIRAFRVAHGLTLAAMGKLVQPPIGREDVWKMEAGQRVIGPGMAARLREAMRARPAGDET
jgi:hypothetical protein